jgi:hypothetical protein
MTVLQLALTVSAAIAANVFLVRVAADLLTPGRDEARADAPLGTAQAA